jgi:hypothetical protein
MNPVYETEFHHDGRGPELIKLHYNSNGSCIYAADYFNPEDIYGPDSIKSMEFIRPQAFMLTPEEEFKYQGANFPDENHAAILCLGKSEWYKSFSNQHSDKCQHYKIMFYDEYLDIICESIDFKKHGFKTMYKVADTFLISESTKKEQQKYFPDGLYAVLEKKMTTPSLPRIDQGVKIVGEGGLARIVPIRGIFQNPQNIISIIFEIGENIVKGQTLELE